VAGTVLATGAAVTTLQVGDRVAGMVFQPIDQRGTYAKHVNLDAGLLAKVPDELTLRQAATIPLVALTVGQTEYLALIHR
jgi:NADPH2:quinone reductase